MSVHGSQVMGKPVPPDKSRFRLFIIVALIIAIVLAVIGITLRMAHNSRLSSETADAALPRVQVINPVPGPAQRTLDLPANVSAWYLAPIYAQVAGYVKMWYKDIGAKVKQGDVLAEIDTPGLDAQYAAAKANLNVAQAHYKLAQITAKRWQALAGTQAVSRQEVDVQTANAEAQKAEVEAALHNAEHYEALEKFKQIVAPFDGVVTARFADVGDYVNAGGGDVSSRGGASELFSVADVHAMRIFVSVPQDYADIISPKLEATMTLPQFGTRVFHARYLATAAAFNPGTRTVNTELVADNAEGELWPDSFATVHFTAPGDPSILTIPEAAIVFRAQGTQVAIVSEDNHIHLQNVLLGTNLGRTVQVLKGIKTTDRIVNNPAAGLLEGDEVRVVDATPGYNAPPKGAQPASPPPSNHDDVRAMPEPGGHQ